MGKYYVGLKQMRRSTKHYNCGTLILQITASSALVRSPGLRYFWYSWVSGHESPLLTRMGFRTRLCAGFEAVHFRDGSPGVGLGTGVDEQGSSIVEDGSYDLNPTPESPFLENTQ